MTPNQAVVTENPNQFNPVGLIVAASATPPPLRIQIFLNVGANFSGDPAYGMSGTTSPEWVAQWPPEYALYNSLWQNVFCVLISSAKFPQASNMIACHCMLRDLYMEAHFQRIIYLLVLKRFFHCQ